MNRIESLSRKKKHLKWKNISKSKDQKLFVKSKELSVKIEEINKSNQTAEPLIAYCHQYQTYLTDVPIGKDENAILR